MSARQCQRPKSSRIALSAAVRAADSDVTSRVRGGAARRRQPRDPCQAGLDLLVLQVLFLQGCRDPEVRATAPAYGIDPEFWGPGCAEYAFGRAIQNGYGPKP